MRIAIGADHLGYPLKESVRRHLEALGYEVIDYGCDDEQEVDYPDVAVKVATDVAAGEFDRAILVCGTGLGMAITANKVPGVRAASVTDPCSAERARKSNNAQVLCLGSRVVGPAVADLLVDHWLDAEFAGGDRHARWPRSMPWMLGIEHSRGARPVRPDLRCTARAPWRAFRRIPSRCKGGCRNALCVVDRAVRHERPVDRRSVRQ